MRFILHHTHENRIGLCAEADGQGLADDAIIARLSFDQTVDLYDDINESFESCLARGEIEAFPGDEGEA